MAIVKCPDCGGTVSSSATACPHCGKPRKAKTSGCAWLALIFIAIPVVAAIGGVMKGQVDRAGEPAKPQISDAECKRDLQCWGDRHHVRASHICEDAVEAEAEYQAEWTDGALEPKFPRMLWADQAKGEITYAGDKVKFQNGFGAWRNMTYLCTYSPSQQRVLQVVVIPR